jgi:prolyl 4-hydroxylase
VSWPTPRPNATLPLLATSAPRSASTNNFKRNRDQLKRSTDQGDIDSETGEQAQTVSSSRTSTNAWCVGECYEQRGTQHLLAKIERILGVPKENFENFQVLNYKVGQFYQTHHDANPANLAMASGHRVYTMFLYFSDVEEGGETDFPKLNISVTPKKGKALLWPSVLSDDPSAIDYRTMHQAKPVLKGTKIAANAWVHTHNYQVPNLWGCTGSFDT